jgi:ABC-type uncharacterized transport system involved in gliding motility auxiliary subunit
MARTTRLQGGLNLAIVILATVVIAIVINVLLGGMRVRFDLSENQVNVLSQASKDAAEALEDLEVRLFISPDLPETIPFGPGGRELRIQGLSQKLREKIDEYKAYGSNMTVTEVSDDVVNEAEKLKVKAFTGEGASLSKEGRLELQRYVLGVSFHYKNATEVFELALEPEYYEFEITKRLLRLKDKAESALTMKDVLATGKDLADAAALCTTALEVAAGPEGDTNPLALMLNPEAAEAKVAALKSAAPKIDEACKKLAAPLAKAKTLERKNPQLDRMRLIGNALAEETQAFSGALGGPDGGGGQLMQTHQRLIAIGKAMADERAELEDTPGRRRIGFVCNATTFCPFPDDKKLVPDELKGAITQQNPMLQNILPVFDRIQQEMNMVLQQINQGLFKARGFDITRIDLDQPIPDDVQALVVFGAKSSFSDYQLYQLDQFVMRGGSLVAFLFPFDVKLQLMNTKGEIDESGTLVKNSSNLDDLLAHWGIKPTKKLIVDRQENGDVVLYAQVQAFGRGFVQQAAFPYPALPTFKDFDTSDPLVRATTSLTLPYPTSLELIPKAGVEVAALARSSASAVQIDDPGFPMYPPQAQTQALAGKTGEGPLTVAAVARGTLESWFKGKEAPGKPADPEEKPGASEPDLPGKAPPRLDSGDGRVLVVGSNLGLLPLSSDAIFEGFNLGMIAGQGGGIEHFETFRGYQVNYQNWSMRIGQVQHTLQSNLQFLQNVLDGSVQREGLAELRSKQYAPRPLSVMDSGDKTFIKVLGLTLPALLFLALGGLWILRRRARTRGLAL